MKATKRQAHNNDRDLRTTFTGYGHWRIEATYRGKRIHTTTTNSEAIDDWKSDPDEKTPRGENRKLAGYTQLCNQIIQDNDKTVR